MSWSAHCQMLSCNKFIITVKSLFFANSRLYYLPLLWLLCLRLCCVWGNMYLVIPVKFISVFQVCGTCKIPMIFNFFPGITCFQVLFFYRYLELVLKIFQIPVKSKKKRQVQLVLGKNSWFSLIFAGIWKMFKKSNTWKKANTWNALKNTCKIPARGVQRCCRV